MKLKQFEDFQLYVRENDWGFWQNSEYEPEETKLIKSLVKPDMVCWDIGANIGYYSILMAKLGVERVYAWEPEPYNYALLVKNIELNKNDNMGWILAHPYAISDSEEDEIELYPCDKNNGMNRLYKSKHCLDLPISVTNVRLDDDYMQACTKPPNFIKIDVEGWEEHVLKGISDVIRKHKPIMLIEFHPPTLQEAGTNPKDVYNFLTNLGYDIRLVPNIDQTISYEDLYKETMKEPSGRNILCLKK